MVRERIKDWSELRDELLSRSGPEAAAELDRLVTNGHRIQALQLLRAHGVSPTDPPRRPGGA